MGRGVCLSVCVTVCVCVCVWVCDCVGVCVEGLGAWDLHAGKVRGGMVVEDMLYVCMCVGGGRIVIISNSFRGLPTH